MCLDLKPAFRELNSLSLQTNNNNYKNRNEYILL